MSNVDQWPCEDCGQVHTGDPKVHSHDRVRIEVDSLADGLMRDLNAARSNENAIYSEQDIARIAIAVAFGKTHGAIPQIVQHIGVETIAKRAVSVGASFMDYAHELGNLGIARGTGGVQ